jgi:two-component system sensor histidine kinase BaeS
MRSLRIKLTLAFVFIGLTGSMLVAVIVGYRTQAAFDQFILNRDQQIMVENLLAYYQANGSWQGVEELIQRGWGHQPPMAQGPELNRNWSSFKLVGQDGRVVYSLRSEELGMAVDSKELERAIQLKVNNEPAGWLVLMRTTREWTPNTPEGAFLRNVNSATLVSALVALVLALILGSLLAYTLTRTIREMREATEEIAQGNLGKQVVVRSHDELGELAISFNKMSKDLEHATQLRRQMTADIAHDLRSPLSVISGYAEALSDGKLPGTPDIYGILHQETLHLDRLVEDLRLLSLADAGELPLTLTPVNPRIILERAVARHAMVARQKEIGLQLETDGELQEVQVDMDRMAQVFDNLLMNAFRYTPKGGTVILSASGSNNNVELQVRDNGRGITEEDLPHLFERFYRGDKSRLQNGESGLGLAIARSIVEVHGGQIGVESKPGEGAKFWIRLKGLEERKE